MTKELQVFKQQEVLGKMFTIYGDAENPLFLAKEVAEWIDYNKDKIGQMLKTIDEEEKETSPIFYSGQVRDMWFISEDGLYEVLMQSHKPIAKQFKKQVKFILKTIRKTGHYETPEYKIMIETQNELKEMKTMLIESGVIGAYVNPTHLFYRLNVSYKITTNDNSHRGIHEAIGNYFGVNVPYSDQIPVTLRDYLIDKVGIEEIRKFIVGIQSGRIVKSKRGNYVNLNGFGSNNYEWSKVVDEFDHKCAYCGISEDKTKMIPEHIVAQSIMSEEHPELCDLVGSIVPACGCCNGSKNTSDMETWFRKQSFFSEYRLQKIQRHIKKYEL
jgi:prophage antirepressor-like protein